MFFNKSLQNQEGDIMHKEEFEKHWNQLKGKIQEKWGKFTYDELNKLNGKYEHFLSQLQKKYGYSKEQSEQELKKLWEGCKECHSPSKHHSMPCHEKNDSCKHHDKNKKHDHGHKDNHRKAS